MRYLLNLRVQLQDRRNRLYKIKYEHYETELRFLLEFLDSNPYLRSLLAMIESSDAVEFDQWITDISTSRGLRFPKSEVGRAKVCLEILKQCAYDDSERQALNWGGKFSHENRFQDILSDLTEAVVDPLLNFLHDHLDEAGNVLYLVERFKFRTEWFRREELYQLYRADTSIGEKQLDHTLRESLFDGGVDYPFSQPASPSGKADIVASLGSADPIVLEVKIFDPDRGKGRSHIRQGFHQVLRYANDYNEGLGYLVVFNCSNRHLVFTPPDGAELESPSRLEHAGKTFYLIAIDIGVERESASKESPSSRVEIRYEELVGD